MERIASFSVDHRTLLPGLYLSRTDTIPGTDYKVSTFDIRMSHPNKEPVMDTGAAHAIEHLGATYLRNDTEWKDRIIYFGPMGCRTGFYLVVAGNYTSHDMLDLVSDMFCWISGFEGDVPGATEAECGHYEDICLNDAKQWARRYVGVLENIEDTRLEYQAFLD